MIIGKRQELTPRMKRGTSPIVATGNLMLDRKIEMAMEGPAPHTRRQLLKEFSNDNRDLIVDFLNDFVTRENISLNTKCVLKIVDSTFL